MNLSKAVMWTQHDSSARSGPLLFRWDLCLSTLDEEYLNLLLRLPV